MFHPFTCTNRGDGNHPVIGGDEGILVPTPDGWRCPFCTYTQDWAWDGMFAEYPVKVVSEEGMSKSQRFFDVREGLEQRLCQTAVDYHRARSLAINPDVIDIAVEHLRQIAYIYRRTK